MVCIPPFGATGVAVLLRLDTLECTPVRFASDVGPSDTEDKGPDVTAALAGNGQGYGDKMDVDVPAD